jgi:hypothetical protein
LRPAQSIRVAKKAEADLNPGADLVDRLDAYDSRGAVALGAKSDPAIAGDDGEESFRRKDGAGHDAQAVPERAPGRQPQELGGY